MIDLINAILIEKSLYINFLFFIILSPSIFLIETQWRYYFKGYRHFILYVLFHWILLKSKKYIWDLLGLSPKKVIGHFISRRLNLIYILKILDKEVKFHFVKILSSEHDGLVEKYFIISKFYITQNWKRIPLIGKTRIFKSIDWLLFILILIITN